MNQQSSAGANRYDATDEKIGTVETSEPGVDRIEFEPGKPAETEGSGILAVDDKVAAPPQGSIPGEPPATGS